MFERRRRRAKICVSIGEAIPLCGPALRPVCMKVEVTNRGKKPAVLTRVNFLLNGRVLLVTHPTSNVQFSIELQPGQSCWIVESSAEIARAIKGVESERKVRLTGICQDEFHESHLSDEFQFDVDAWAE